MNDKNLYMEILEKFNSGILIVKDQVNLEYMNEEGKKILDIQNIKKVNMSNIPNSIKKFIAFEKEIERFEVSEKNKIIGITLNKIKNKSSIYMVAIFKDITDIKNIEISKHRESKFAVLGELALSIAHEVRNPLNIIRGFSQLITESEDIEYIKSTAEIIVQEVDRLGHLAESLLRYGREERIKKEKLELVSFIGKLLNRLEMEERAKMGTDKDEMYIMGDKEKLIQVFLNVIKNALEAMEGQEEKLFEIEVRKRGKYTIVIFRNNGEVKKDLNLKDIFMPFFTTKASGTGLGLAISKKIIEKHEGKIYAMKNKYNGMTFKIIFKDTY